jgi:hypothetical protein
MMPDEIADGVKKVKALIEFSDRKLSLLGY